MKVKTIEGAPATDAAQDDAGATVARGFEQTLSHIKAGVAAATAGFEQTQEQMKQQMDKALRTAEELVSFGQGNLEAMMKSSQIWLAGFQDISKQVATNAQAQVDATASALRALSTARSPKEALELQANLARTSFEKAIAETRRLTDSAYKLAEETVAPLTARVTLAFEKFGRTTV
jgi:phasin family protein